MRRGTRVGQAYVAVTADGSGINKEIVDSVDEAGPGVERAGKEHGERYGDGFGDGLDLDDVIKRLGDEMGRRLDRQADKMGNSFSQRFGRATDRLSDKIGTRLSESLTDALDDTLAHFGRMVDTMEGRLSQVSGNGGGGGGGGGGGPRGRPVGAGDDGDRMADLVSRLFGGGSRNNALNLLGKTMGAVVSLTEKAGTFATRFAQGLTTAGEGATLVEKALSVVKGGGGGGGAALEGVSGGLKGISVSGPLAIAALIAVIGTMSVMISVAGALTAILTALAATIASALAGALLVAGAGMTALLASASLLTLAFMSMTDAQRTLLSDAFEPLHQELIGIGQLMITQMIPYFGVWSQNLQEALLLAAPAAAAMGDAFGRAGASLTAALSGPGFQNLAYALSTYLPSITLKLTDAFGSLLNGAAGVFAALMPLVERFATYLSQVTERFSTWANSAQGQNAIVDFAERAVDSLMSLWDAVREVSGFIFDVLFDPNAQAAGNSIFDSIAKTFEGLRKKLAAASRDGSLKKWFDDAIEFGGHLWSVIRALANLFGEFYDSGMLDAIGSALESLANALDFAARYTDPLIDAVGGLAGVLSATLTPIDAVIDGLGKLTDKAGGALNVLKAIPVVGGWVGGLAGMNSGSGSSGGTFNPITSNGTYGQGLGVLLSNKGPSLPQMPDFDFDIDSLIASGTSALNQTSQSHGGYKPPKEEAKWKNPYVAWANSLIEKAPSELAQVRDSTKKINRQFREAIREAMDSMVQGLRDVQTDAINTIRDAARSTDSQGVTAALTQFVTDSGAKIASAAENVLASAKSQADSMRSAADSTVASARSNLNAAASRLASASSPKEAARALKEVKAAQAALTAAEKAQNKAYEQAERLVQTAIEHGREMEMGVRAANAIIEAQSIVDQGRAQALVNGERVLNATLADYAAARGFVADQLEIANQKLADALAVRDDYNKAVVGSIKAFGALTTATAQTINGVEQALTSGDITSNLQTRLDKVRKFNENLRILLAQGLSNEAYKQLVDEGVEGGSAYAEALVQGGQGAISEVNNLTSQIAAEAGGLGEAASSRLYQAGVDAAQGLVDGLTSLSEQLDSAAYALGESIADAISRALGIHSPSRVLRGMMGPVGDGAVLGLDDQHAKVGSAAARLAGQIAVSPEVARYAAAQSANPVSGNDPKFVWTGDIVTPTKDPAAVTHEVLNELTARMT